MKINERLVMPLIYLPSAADPIGSPAYMQAIAEGRRPPGPLEDPTGWSGKKMSRVVKRGVFSPKKAKYDVTLLLPTPGKFSRYTYLPFAIKVSLVLFTSLGLEFLIDFFFFFEIDNIK